MGECAQRILAPSRHGIALARDPPLPAAAAQRRPSPSRGGWARSGMTGGYRFLSHRLVSRAPGTSGSSPRTPRASMNAKARTA